MTESDYPRALKGMQSRISGSELDSDIPRVQGLLIHASALVVVGPVRKDCVSRRS